MLVYIVGVSFKPANVRVALATRIKRETGLPLSIVWPLAKGHGVELPASAVQTIADIVSGSRDIVDAALHDGQKYIYGRSIH